MKLPPLSLDLRKATLDADKKYVDAIDAHDRVFMRIYKTAGGSYDHAGEMVDRVNKYPSAIAALRKLAIIPTMAPGHQNEVVHDGYRCRVCKSTFRIGVDEIHSTDCPLKGTKP